MSARSRPASIGMKLDMEIDIKQMKQPVWGSDPERPKQAGPNGLAPHMLVAFTIFGWILTSSHPHADPQIMFPQC